MNKIYETAKRMVKKATLVGLVALALGGCTNSIDQAIERDAKRTSAKRYTSQVTLDSNWNKYLQRNGALTATRQWENGSSSTLIDANGNGYFEKRLEFVPGQEPRLEVDSNDGEIYGFPK